MEPDNLGGSLYGLLSDERPSDAMDLAGWRLKKDGEPGLFGIYLTAARAAEREDEAKALLREGMQRRPVNVEWHRTYQSVSEDSGSQDALIAEYDELLAGEPDNADLLYLRGRLSMRVTEGARYYDRALAIDHGHAYANFAKGYGLAAKGDWRAAEGAFAAACEASPEREDYVLSLAESRLALRDFDGLESGLEACLDAQPASFEVAAFLGIALQAQGRTNAVNSMVRRYCETVADMVGAPSERSAILRDAYRGLQLRLLYAAADYHNLLLLAGPNGGEPFPYQQFVALLESDRLEEAARMATPETLGSQDPFVHLAASLAWLAAGDDAGAAPWEAKAIELLENQTLEHRQVAAWLKSPDAVTLNEIRELTIQPQPKAILLCAMALKRTSEADAKEFLTEAGKLNVRPQFPFHLVRILAAFEL